MRIIDIIRKPLFSLVLCVVCASTGAAQETTEQIMERLENAVVRKETVRQRFKEVRTAVNGARTELEGMLTYTPESYLLMDYTDGNVFLIDGDRMEMGKSSKPTVFDLTKNIMMRGLSHALLYSFQGRGLKLSQEQKTTIEAVREAGRYVVTLKAVKQAARGYKRIVVFYDAATCAIESMIMEEFNGASTCYSL
ncbi:MAG: hypothetical protein MJY45_05385 [Bacteroidales bacterium]|nr:hypothetical protein [Bacteroidales bacterium]